MEIKWSGSCASFVLPLLVIFSSISVARERSTPTELYVQNCAKCHDQPENEHIPSKKLLSALQPELIFRALGPGGRMEQAGRNILNLDRLALAEYLTGKKIVLLPEDGNLCTEKISAEKAVEFANSNLKWSGWGSEPANSRHQSADRAKLPSDQIAKLKLKWSFGFSGGEPRGQPTIVGDVLLTSSSAGKVYALNRKTGCLYWSFATTAEMKHAFAVGQFKFKGKNKVAVFFGDVLANMYALDLSNGSLLWKRSIEKNQNGRITGSPILVGSKLIVPMSSAEEVFAIDPGYACCSFRGSLSALDPVSGKTIWQSFPITGPLKQTRKKGPEGNALKGPAGAGIWSSPTYDEKLGLLYVGTGNDYSLPATKFSDAILAFNVKTGKIVWSNQLIPNDTYNASCFFTGENCPKKIEPTSDTGFGSSTILKTLKNGKRILLAGSKGGQVYALDPDDKGKLKWQARAGDGGILGGIEWGFTADDETVYVGVVDYKGKDGPGMVSAFSLSSGELVWHKANGARSCKDKLGCAPAISAALSSVTGAIFAGTTDGFLRALSTKDGSLLWEFATKQDFKTVNGIAAKGGSINATGPVIVDGMVYITSGYGFPNFASLGGNVLLAFSP